MGVAVVYSSMAPDLRVGLSYILRKPDGEIKYDKKMNPMISGEVKFIDGELVLDSVEDAELIELLSKHKGNIANGGKSFKIQGSNRLALKAVSEGAIYAEAPEDGIQEADIEALKYLSTTGSCLPPNAYAKVLREAKPIYERFKFANLPAPNDKLSQKGLHARVVIMLETLSEREIWKYDDPAREALIGETETSDK